MALIKSKTLKNGQTGGYWKITVCTPSYQTMQVSYTLELFTSKAYSKVESLGGTKKLFSFTLTKAEMAGDLRAIGYTKILAKANHIVKAATDSTPAVYGDADLNNAESDF